ncbi:hypothetical protein GQ457_01G005320 [Hibiscus cannabinus]
MYKRLEDLDHRLEEKFKAAEGPDARELSLVPNLVLPMKFKMPEFEKFDGTSSPAVHLTMFCRRMTGHVDNDELLIHCFQDSLKGSAARWYNQLTRDKIRSWKDLAKAFIEQYKHITDIEPDRITLQNMEMRPNESFRQYVQRWRDVAAQQAIELSEWRWVYQNCQDVRRGGSGCVMWFGDLTDIKQFQSDGQDLYIRVSASEAELKKKVNMKLGIILGTVIAALMGFVLVICYIRRSRRTLKDKVEDKNVYDNENENKDENEDMELAVFAFGTIAQATDTFSSNNKLGEGGFGPVYKGTLANGQEIAVKRLSKSSGQGLNEFKNEVKLIAKLQHRNLVRLLGCCIHGDERMLVYEYMPNRSLDSFIFDQMRSKVLTWSKRFQIICGIARGLLYLHQDSRLRIIHRDLKASNVLLDSQMNPKISDFGMARTFGGEQTEANTNRVVGTYGYMAPEYATDGLFSIKSDVFSFGIAWRLWEEGKPLDVADDFLVENGDLSELLRCIHISLLCVQQHPEERPSMSSVVVMLVSHNELPSPKQPGFLFSNKPFEADCSSGNDRSSSRNEITIPTEDKRSISLLVSSSLGHTSYLPPKIKLCTSQGAKGIDFQFIFQNNLKKKPGSELNKYGVVITPS